MPTIAEKEQEYREYIDTHRANVKLAYERIVKKYANKYLMPQSVEILERNIENHDADKDIDFIFDAYRRNHFPVDEEEKRLADNDYEIAWSYHSKINPHHWQFFLDDDNKKFTTPKLETDEVKEIYKLAYLEMLADWLSFGFKLKQDEHKDDDEIVSTKGDNLEFENWYNKNKNEIMIHPDMKEWLDIIIKDIITDIKENSKQIYGESYTFNSKEKKHQDGDSYIIRTDKGFIKFQNNSYKIVQNINSATISYNKDDLKMMLLTLLRKFPQIKAAKVSTIADAKKELGIKTKEDENIIENGNTNNDEQVEESIAKDGIEVDGIKGTIANSGMAM